MMTNLAAKKRLSSKTAAKNTERKDRGWTMPPCRAVPCDMSIRYRQTRHQQRAVVCRQRVFVTLKRDDQPHRQTDRQTNTTHLDLLAATQYAALTRRPH